MIFSLMSFIDVVKDVKENVFGPEFINGKEEIIGSFDKLYQKNNQPYTLLQITPSTNTKNNRAYLLAKVMAGFYRSPNELMEWFNGKAIFSKKDPYRFNFRIVMKVDEIGFYLVVPDNKVKQIIRKAESIYDNRITISKVDDLPKLKTNKTFCTELKYRKHDIFSLDADKKNSHPLPSLLNTFRSLEDDDVAIFDSMFEPQSRSAWNLEAKKSHNMLKNGEVPSANVKMKLLRTIHQVIDTLRNEFLSVFVFTNKQKEEFEVWQNNQGQSREAKRLRDEMTNYTKRKQDSDVLESWIRIAVESEDEDRAKDAVYTLANAYKDITGDNELERHDIPKSHRKKYIRKIEESEPSGIGYNSMKLSCEEAGKFLQLPEKDLIEEYPNIKAQRFKEVSVSNELYLEGVKSIRLGYVNERGEKKLAGLPLEAYKGVETKEVYDALCTPTLGTGKMGTGKTEGFGTVTAYDMVMAGMSVFIIDTADGDMLNKFIDSLPIDYPDLNIHAINIDNRKWPIPLGWEDIFGRQSNENELESLVIGEKLTKRFISFINSLTDSGPLTDRMEQYITSCMRAVSARSKWSFLDLELALTSPSYREELLEKEEVRNKPDLISDIKTLQSKAINNSVYSITNPIMSRLKKLTNSVFVENMFYQKPKLNSKSKPILDFRKIMDNKKGDYGHVVVIKCTHDEWQSSQTNILNFLIDKINFNIFSRVDIKQDERKPCMLWIDEPHKIISLLEGQLIGPLVEYRKYRAKILLTAHHLEQMGKAADSLLSGGVQITSYKTEKTDHFKQFGHAFSPYDDPIDLYKALPEKHTAINRVRLPSGKNCPAFIADMVAPPKRVKDRSYIWGDCSKRYGRHWKDVRNEIDNKRKHYKVLDEKWLFEKNEDLKLEEARDKAEKKKARKEAEEKIGV